MRFDAWFDTHRDSKDLCAPEMEPGDAADILSEELLDGTPISFSCNGKQALAEVVGAVVEKYGKKRR